MILQLEVKKKYRVHLIYSFGIMMSNEVYVNICIY